MDSPYAPPSATSEPPAPQPAGPSSQWPKPTVISVMGVLYLLGSCGGFLIGLLSVIELVIGDLIPGRHSAIQALPGWLQFLSYGFGAAVSCLMFAAGLKLVKGRRDALRASNRYLIALVAGKFLAVPIAFAVPSPTQGNGDDALIPIAGHILLSLLISLILPAICFLVLNRQKVKSWLAACGT